MLSQQSLAARGEVEVVLVDSNSPADELGAFAAFAAQHDLPIVYARSAERETIQAAWNRGIKLSRAPYLTCLGADEGLHPDALRQLAAALDADPVADWAIADSLVTSVDRHGVFDADVMPYDRRGYRQDLVYLETCYLSWVGGLYRRTIHDRFGWYDESFRAAGDTEFKCRILPHIRSVYVPRMLGVFNNYPEARTTQHPRAELEDLRAWYLWRSAAGMHYAFARRPAADAVQLLRDSLSYRKSYCTHLSTDFDVADALAEFLTTRPDAPAWAQRVRPQTAAAIALLRRVELLPKTVLVGPRGIFRSLWLHRQLRSARRLAAAHRAAFGLSATPHYDIFNDNRYEQHWYSWSAS
jgi:glycosyltransferase involved in cell wall biosynthesis